MTTSAVNSAIEVASWFLDRAQKEEWCLESEKLQHLLFLSQFHYALDNNLSLLMPSYFMAVHNGFKEPNIEQVMVLTKGYLPTIRIPSEISSFLEKIWKVYGAMSIKQLSQIIRKHTNCLNDYNSNTKNIVEIKSLIENYKSHDNMEKAKDVRKNNEKKILISQNGPVVVSKWQPRKLEN